MRYLLPFILILAGCTRPGHDTLLQVARFDQFSQGQYDGILAYSEVLKTADYGLGSFDRLDGEMVMIAGKVFRISPDGSAHRMGPEATTPIVTAIRFHPDEVYPVSNIGFDSLKQFIQRKISPTDLCAIRITGDFEELITRSVYAQNKPYQPISEVVKNEVRKISGNISGTAIGFKSPEPTMDILWPGFHFHFLSSDETTGGHILDFRLREGKVEVDFLTRVNLVLKPVRF